MGESDPLVSPICPMVSSGLLRMSVLVGLKSTRFLIQECPTRGGGLFVARGSIYTSVSITTKNLKFQPPFSTITY